MGEKEVNWGSSAHALQFCLGAALYHPLYHSVLCILCVFSDGH